MKSDTVVNQEVWLKEMEIFLPSGLMGLPEIKKLELIYHKEELPFMWLRSAEDPALAFVVIQPNGNIPNYEFEVPEDDASALSLEDAADALVFNIITIQPDSPEDATVNLIGPVIVNRKTLVGKQVIISNYHNYSAKHPLQAVESNDR